VALRRLTLALALLVSVAAIAGCGGDSTSSTAGASGATGASSTGDPVADADAKAAARNAQVALETYATTTNGSYAGADVAGLSDILPSLAKADLTVTADASTYTVDVVSTSGATFSVVRSKDGAVAYICEPPGTGGCPDSGDWS
jgi:ABC-type oligopeptide transport system substrate-binding subunit